MAQITGTMPLSRLKYNVVVLVFADEIYRNVPKCLDRQVWANSVDPAPGGVV